jgi:hypothetical protein
MRVHFEDEETVYPRYTLEQEGNGMLGWGFNYQLDSMSNVGAGRKNFRLVREKRLVLALI